MLNKHLNDKEKAPNMRPTCKTEGCYNPCKNNGHTKSGNKKYKALCPGCCKRKYSQGRLGGYVKNTCCEHCGFVALHRCQLDIDHIDGNHNNNDPSNLQTLCSNCHRLKTWINKDYKSVRPSEITLRAFLFVFILPISKIF